MNVAIRRVEMSVDEFLLWEERQELRYEFDGIAPRAMTGGTAGHSHIAINLYVALGSRLTRKPFRPFDSSVKLRMAKTVRYPDAMVVRTPVDRKATWTTEPTVVFEILSDSTRYVDQFEKMQEYTAVPSLMRYVLLEEDHVAAVVYARQGEVWVATALTGDAVLDMPEIGIAVPLPELYEGLDLPPEKPRGDERPQEVA
ncbi:MAG TPA: Uma2 family endonuclease [Acidisphaera sp.]|nr:Uma2 family endonuclease [Acidisphaera sp.]